MHHFWILYFYFVISRRESERKYGSDKRNDIKLVWSWLDPHQWSEIFERNFAPSNVTFSPKRSISFFLHRFIQTLFMVEFHTIPNKPNQTHTHTHRLNARISQRFTTRPTYTIQSITLSMKRVTLNTYTFSEIRNKLRNLWYIMKTESSNENCENI